MDLDSNAYFKPVLAFGRGQANLLGRWPIWLIGQGQRPKLAAKMLLAFGRGQANLLGRWPIWQRPNRPNRPRSADNIFFKKTNVK